MSANDKQVGGSHYASEYQHWDLVIDLDVPYIEAQLTKYTGRHAKKNGRQDLEKAMHFAEKLRESVVTRRVRPNQMMYRAATVIEQYFSSNQHLGCMERDIIRKAISWQTLPDVENVIAELRSLVALAYPREEE